MKVGDLPTPALLVHRRALDANIATMAARWPGRSLRPHVKAFKSTAMARHLAEAGHPAFCAATTREIEGLAAAGLGDDLLLANECLDPARLGRLADLVAAGTARVTVAVDSDATVAAAASAGLREVLVDVNVGLPRCGCPPENAARLADRARTAGLEVRGVMGYEGHLMVVEDPGQRRSGVAASMALLTAAHAEVGGDVVSGGGTGTWDTNTAVTELQAGSYTLMDTAYDRLGLPFGRGLSVLATVVSVHPDGYAVADAGLKSLGMDHGNPSIDGAAVWFCSDEHITFAPAADGATPRAGDRVAVWPAHIDPTIALHEVLHVVDAGPGEPIGPDADVVEVWPVDLRHW